MKLRSFIKIWSAIAVAAILAIQISCARADAAGEDNRTARAKNIILFIGDGMHLQNEIALSRYLHGTDFDLSWHKFPYYCYVTTWDIDTYNRYAQSIGKPKYAPQSFDANIGYDPSRGGLAPYPIDKNGERSYFLNALTKWGGGSDTRAVPATDSAAAASAIATGMKTDAGNVSWKSGDPPGGALKTIAELVREHNRWSFGVVTNVQFSHATPSPFVAHNVSRGNPGQIAREMINVTKPDVIIGGGHPNWNTGYISSNELNTLRNSTEYLLVERTTGRNGAETLLETALQARKWSYAPYSKYHVGAALITTSGRIYDGVNIENAAYPVTICAERVAIFKAVSEGDREFVALAVVSDNGAYPCGSCRQVLAEFGLDTRVIIANRKGENIHETTVRELLPQAFRPENLKTT